MRDYLTNLAARSLERAPAIQPRLAALFEPLSLMGPLFPRLGRFDDRFEVDVARNEPGSDTLPQTRADREPENNPLISVRATASLNSEEEESRAPNHSDAALTLSDDQSKPVATTVEFAKPEPSQKKTPDDSKRQEHIVSVSRLSEESKARIAAPAIGVPASDETSHREKVGHPDKFSERAKDQVVVTSVADANETLRPGESARAAKKLVEPRGSVRLNESRSPDRSSAIIPLDHFYQNQSPQSLIVTRATAEVIRAERGARAASAAESAALPSANGPSSIASLKPPRDPRLRRADPGAEESISSETQPSINVTIGRVEIRAQPPTVSRPPGKNSNSPKLMGLDDYLRQRAQGGKR
jgi:hypothetical protein